MQEKQLKSSWCQFIVASMGILLIMGTCSFILYKSHKKYTEFLEAERAADVVRSVQQLLKFEFESIVADVRLLSKMQESNRVFNSHMTAELAKNLLYFTLDKKTYDTIRYMDMAGMELFRINYRNGNPVVVSREALRDNCDTYYHEGSRKLKVGGVYISALDLDTEVRAQNTGHKPIMRIAAPLFSFDGTRQGVVMLNYLGNRLCRIMELGAEGPSENPMLLNDEGYWLRSDNDEEEWGFMRKGGEDLTFQSRFPDEWTAVSQAGTGQIRTQNGLFTFATVDPGECISEESGIQVVSDAGKWVVMTHVPVDKLTASPKAYLAKLSTALIPLSLIIMGGLYFLCRFRQNSKQAQLDIMVQHVSYGRFVPKEFLALLHTGHYRDVTLNSHVDHEMFILFSDIRSYTKLSEGKTHSELLQFLNEYLAVVNQPIEANKGFVDSFHGDALLALFEGGNAENAVRAAIAMQQGIQQFNVDRVVQGEKPLAAGIGLHFGEVTLGALGTEERMQATVIGDEVNLAARIESSTKTFGVRVIISDCVYKHLPSPSVFNLREIDTVRVKGKQIPVVLYEVFDTDPDDVIRQKQAILPFFAKALALYRQGDFEVASQLFDECRKRCPDDTISPIFFKRCKMLLRVPPGDGWTGISTL